MREYKRKYRKENYPVLTLNKGDHIRFKHREASLEGKFLYFNFDMTRFRAELVTNVELWVNVYPQNIQIKTRYLNGNPTKTIPGK